jgi:hypothetical protein
VQGVGGRGGWTFGVGVVVGHEKNVGAGARVRF